MKAIFKDGAFSLGYSITSRASLLISNLIAVKILSVHDYGVLSLYLMIVTSIATLSTFGLGVTCNKIAAGNCTSDPELVRAVVLGSTFISIILAFLVASSYWPFVQEDYLRTLGAPLAYFSILLVAVFISASSVFEGALFGTTNYRLLFKNAAVSIALAIPVMGFAAKLLGIQGAIAAIIFGRASIMLMNLVSLYQRGWITSTARLIRKRAIEIKKALLQTSLPLALSGILAGPTIAAALTLVIDRHGLPAASFFAWPYQIYLVATFVPGALGHFFTSRFSQASDQSSQKSFRTATLLNTGFAFAAFVVMILLQDTILSIAGRQFITNAEETYLLFAYCTILYGLNVGFISYWTSINLAWMQFMVQILWSATLIMTVILYVESKGPASIPLGFIYGYLAQTVLNSILFIANKKNEFKQI